MERFQDLENVKVVSENGKGITRRNANANERVLSWRETAARAGVVTMVTNQEEESNVVEPTQPHGKKRKTPKQYRLAPPKLPKHQEITAADKKKFKEMFLTDKSRLDKRQPTFNRERNFILIMEDSIHSKHSKSATGGKLMVFGRGDLMKNFLNEGIIYNADDFYVHANTADFEEEVLNKISEPANGGGEDDDRVGAKPDLEKVAKRAKHQKKIPEASRPLTKYDLYLRASQKNARTSISVRV